MRAVLRQRPVDMDVAIRTQATYIALERLAAELQGIPGRKNVVWVTDGVPLTLGPIRSDTGDVVDFTPQLRKLSAALDRAQIAIYPSRQIMLGSNDAPSDAPGVPHSGGAGSGVASAETLNQFAAMTGGRPGGGRDIGAAVAQAMTDARTSYEIGYFAPVDNWNGKFHKLRVVCKRKGVKLQTKTGYYAWPENPQDIARQSIQTAIAQRLDAAEIGIRATLNGSHLKANIDPHDIALLPVSGNFQGHVDVALVGKGPSSARPIDLSMKAADQPIVYEADLPAGDAPYVRLIVFDEISENVGSLTIPLKH
ncbi:MAG: VWA domain-containing protein, partial [Acidobacteriota bacterium]|nr:VWA domain-containing protein [Acidobacteriota bacterium]